MRDEIDRLTQELQGQTFDICRESYLLRRGSERAIQIISEAARALPEGLRAQHPDTPWAEIIAIGNPLRHAYHKVDAKVLWETATVDLPKLRPVIASLLAQSES